MAATLPGYGAATVLVAGDGTSLSWITGHPWVYPSLEVTHIVGIAMLLGSLLVLELRVWGQGDTLPVAALSKLAMKISLTGFALAVMSGTLMFASQMTEMMSNRAFVWKLLFLSLAGSNAGLFHAREGLVKLDRVARVQTLVSLGLWLAVIICGRWIAYV